MSPLTQLTIALVIGALVGSFCRVWASPSFDTWSKRLAVEVFSNGVAGLLLPYVGRIEFLRALLPVDLSALPPVAAGAGMFFVALATGDFVPNLLKRFGMFGGSDKPSN